MRAERRPDLVSRGFGLLVGSEAAFSVGCAADREEDCLAVCLAGFDVFTARKGISDKAAVFMAEW